VVHRAGDAKTRADAAVAVADYQQRYGVSSQCCSKSENEAYSQDNLFSTLLGLLGSAPASTRQQMIF
jgi:glucan phosphoethanolaminetransferase (alkaline phosphatase superfamily)